VKYLLTSIAIAAALVAGCSKKQETTATDQVQVIKLGFSAPLTGPQSHYGKDMQNGVELALQEVNDSQPKLGDKAVRFELMVEDDQADPKTATQVAQRFVDAKVSGILGHFNSGTSIPASKIYHQAGIPQLAMASAAAYTQQGFNTTFRMFTSDAQQGSTLGKYVVETIKAKNVAIIDDRTAYGQGLADEFEKAAKAAGATIVKREYTTDKDTDFTAILTAIKGSQPDVIFYGGADAQSAPMIKQMHNLGVKAILVSGDMTRSDTFLKLAGKEAEGAIASSAGVPPERMPNNGDFIKRFAAKYGPVQTYGPYAYDGAKAMMAAILKAGSADPKVYLPVLAKTDIAAVTINPLRYDAKGDVENGSITVYQVKDGKWQELAIIGGKAP
jgi:branched-chain amino acid transport system substrate-binding protein